MAIEVDGRLAQIMQVRWRGISRIEYQVAPDAGIFGIAGEHEDALIAGEEAVKISSSSWALAMFGWVQARAGFRDQAEAILQHLRQRASTEYVARSGIAGILSGLGRLSEAWDELVRAKREQEPILGWSRVDPRWEPLRRVLPRL